MCRLMPIRERYPLAMLTCGAGVGSYPFAALVVAPGTDLVRHVAWFLFSFVFYLLSVISLLRVERADQETGRQGHRPLRAYLAGDGGRVDLALILGLAILFRLPLLATTPSLSDDVFRYVWDGKLLNAGIDPHLYPPDAPELAHLRGPLWEGINHKSMATPYPPLAEALFALVYRVAPESIRAMQAAAVLFDLGVIALLMAMLARAGLDSRRVLVYAWNPLVLVQFAHSAHYDAAMILPLLGAIYALSLGRRLISGLLLGVSVLVKLVPAAVGPLFLPAWGITGTVAAGAVVGACLLPWLFMGPRLDGLLSEASDARFNDSLGYLLHRSLGLIVADPETASRAMAGVAMVVVSFSLGYLLWRRGADWRGLLRGTYLLLGLFLLLNAVVEPWYLAWIVPFLCFFLASGPKGLPRLQPALGWLLLSGLVVLTDLTYLPEVGATLWVWVRVVEYGPLYLLLLISGWRWATCKSLLAVAR